LIRVIDQQFHVEIPGSPVGNDPAMRPGSGIMAVIVVMIVAMAVIVGVVISRRGRGRSGLSPAAHAQGNSQQYGTAAPAGQPCHASPERVVIRSGELHQ
jgi:hypothetical protein